MAPHLAIATYVSSFVGSPVGKFEFLTPWSLVHEAEAIVTELIVGLPPDFLVNDGVAVHRTAVVERGAVLKPPLVLGAGSFVAAGAYLRGGNWIAENCVIGPGVEVKSSFIFSSTKLAHFNFVGDSVVGGNVNLEAGSIICNCRNERIEREVTVRVAGQLHGIKLDKFGALVGDDCRIGANAVVAPGAVLERGAVVGRGQVIDQERDEG